MKYTKLYNDIITKAKNRTTTEYTEKHHIVPRCMGGTNDSFNLVKLTAKEHFVCHLLLTKMYPCNLKLVHAFNMMLFIKPGREELIFRKKITSKL